MSKLTGPIEAVAADILTESSTQEHDLGTKAITPDGRCFRYVKAGSTALVAGKLYDGPATVSNHSNLAVVSAVSAGGTQVTVTLGATAATANQYANGYLVVNDVTGQGYTYQIKSHPAANASTNLVVTLYENDAIIEALDTTSQVTLIANQYDGVVIHAATEAGLPVGVAVYDITANYYGWVQTRGIVSCLSDATPATVGASVAASESTDGATTLGTGVLAPIGYAPILQVSTEYNPIFLTIDG